MFCQDIRQLAQGQLNPFDQRGSAGAGFVAGGIKRALEVVKDRQKVAGKSGAAVLFSLAPIAFGAFAGVFSIRQRAPEAVAQLITLGPQGVKLICGDEVCNVIGSGIGGVGLFGGQIVLRHGLLPSLSCFGLAPAAF